MLLAKLVRLVISVAVLLLMAGIAVRLFEVHAAWITDAARWLARPFDDLLDADNRSSG